ncbi:hypothetical protein [Oenococcus phage Vinitor-27]|nr:hypothetical protein [Oenococcus phage Vinitor-27]
MNAQNKVAVPDSMKDQIIGQLAAKNGEQSAQMAVYEVQIRQLTTENEKLKALVPKNAKNKA